MKVLFFIDQLYTGGAGRVASILIDGLAEKGYEVILVVDHVNYPIMYSIDPTVKIVQSFLFPKRRYKFLRPVDQLKNILYNRSIIKREKPDAIVTFNSLIFFWITLSKLFLNIPLITSDHTSMGRDLGRFINFIRHRYYAKADAVTVLTEKDAKLVENELPNKVVIYNPVTFTPNQNVLFDGRKKALLCVGRIDQWQVKGFDIMLKIWAKIRPKHSDWSLDIVGPGKQESINELMDMATSLRIEDSVTFIGNQSDMESVYQQYPIFCLSSRVEGFPMVLIEAMTQGCACISFSMQNAIREIITDGEDGLIIPDGDIDLFSDSLSRLIEDYDYRVKLAKAGMSNVGRFSKDSFIERWTALIDKVTNN